MELGLSLEDPQGALPTFTTGSLSLGLWFSTERAIQSRGQEHYKQSDSDDCTLHLGIPWTTQARTTYLVGSPCSREASAATKGRDNEENGLSSSSRKKLRLSKEQSISLEESFGEHQTLNPEEKGAIAKELGLPPRQVEVWFQNRRARTKVKQAEVDCSYLKRSCEILTAENRRLQKQLDDLQALMAVQSFNMEFTATTLSLCPSCERISTTGRDGNHRKTSSFARLLDKRGFFPLAGPLFHQPSLRGEPAME